VSAGIRTERLVLRSWREADRDPWAALNADPEVMRYFPSTYDRQRSDAAFTAISTQLDDRGWGLWAVDHDGEFIGFTGLAVPRFAAAFTPAVEIGWRLARDAWGHGFATEAASSVLTFAFEELGLDEVVSFTSVVNERSRRVMERIGMTHDPRDDFDHPDIEVGNYLGPHVLYRASRSVPMHN
jgi:RimJ/RimL family protein N-acetyltransferase